MPGTYALLLQLLGQTPTLLVYIAGIVLGIRFLHRSPTAAKLVIAGSALLILLVVGWAITFQWAIRTGNIQRLSAMSVALNCLYAIGHGLWLAGAFAGRGGSTAGFDVQQVPFASTAGASPHSGPPPIAAGSPVDATRA